MAVTPLDVPGSCPHALLLEGAALEAAVSSPRARDVRLRKVLTGSFGTLALPPPQLKGVFAFFESEVGHTREGEC